MRSGRRAPFFLVCARFYRRESKARTLKHYKVRASKAPRRKVRASKMRQGARARLENAPRRGPCEAPRACIARVDAHCSEMLLISHISYALPPRRRRRRRSRILVSAHAGPCLRKHTLSLIHRYDFRLGRCTFPRNAHSITQFALRFPTLSAACPPILNHAVVPLSF